MKKKAIENMLGNNTHLPFNLQFFADGGSNQGDGGNEDDPDAGGEGDDSEGDEGDDSGSDDGKPENEKKFTQAEMTARAAKEKKQGRRSAFKEMGFKDEKEAKAEMAEYRKWKESQMTPEQKLNAQIKDANDGKSEAEKRAEAAENKLAALEAGVKKDAVEDAVAIAMLKVTEDKSLDDVLNEMKTEPKYKGFFDGSEDDDDDNNANGGTGSSVKHKKASKSDNIGKRLGEQASKSTVTKSNFFRN